MNIILLTYMEYYHFMVIINIVTTAVVISSKKEIRKVFNPSFSWINTHCVHFDATCQDDCLLKLDWTGTTEKLLWNYSRWNIYNSYIVSYFNENSSVDWSSSINSSVVVRLLVLPISTVPRGEDQEECQYLDCSKEWLSVQTPAEKV